MQFKKLISTRGQELSVDERSIKRECEAFTPEATEDLFYAAARGDVTIIKAALNTGFDPNTVCNGNPILHTPICSEQGTAADRRTVVELLLDRGADPECLDANGWTALLTACDRTDEAMVRSLLERGANAAACDNKGWSAIHYLTYRQADREMFKLLVGAGSDLDHRSTADGNTSLMIAVDRADSTRVRTLLDLGANPTIARNDALTALHMAANKGLVEIARWLLDEGADVNAKGGQMVCTALHMAAGAAQRGFVELLLERGADIAATDRNGYIPLDVANGTGAFEIAAILSNSRGHA